MVTASTAAGIALPKLHRPTEGHQIVGALLSSSLSCVASTVAKPLLVGIVAAVTDRPGVGSLRQSCLAQALSEADAVLRPPERRRYPVNIAKPQRGVDLPQAGHRRPRFDHPIRKSIGDRRHPQCRGPVRLLMDGLGHPGYRLVVTTG